MKNFGDSESRRFVAIEFFESTSVSPAASPRHFRGSRGFSLLELVGVMAIALVMGAMAVPLIQSSVSSFRLRAAVASVTGAIQSTRYRAIFDGCPYQIAFTKANNTYQISNEVTGGACASTFTKVDGPTPFAVSSQVVLNQDIALQFSPGGSIQVIAGSLAFNLTVAGSSNQKAITVTKYGSITVQ